MEQRVALLEAEANRVMGELTKMGVIEGKFADLDVQIRLLMENSKSQAFRLELCERLIKALMSACGSPVFVFSRFYETHKKYEIRENIEHFYILGLSKNICTRLRIFLVCAWRTRFA